MRLLQRILPTLRHTQKPPQKFLAHLLGLLLMLPGHATFRHLRRYSTYHERTCARWSARDFAFVSFNQAALLRVISPTHPQALVSDARFVPTSGKNTYGLDRCWNSRHSRTEKGLEISALAWLDIPDHCASCLSVAQTPSTGEAPDPETPRSDVSLEQLTRVVSEQQLSHRRYVITDGYDRKPTFLGGVRALGLAQMGTRRLDAHLRSLSQGPHRPGPGRPKTYDGKVHWDDLARFETGETDDDIVLSQPVLHHGHCQCTLRVVRVVDTQHHQRAVLFSTDVALDALPLYRDDNARRQIACLFRDAKQLTGLTDCHARAHAQRTFHCQASLSAVTLATLTARQQHGEAAAAFSMARLKRRACNHQLIERLAQHVAQGHSVETSSPAYEELCHYGTITEMAA